MNTALPLETPAHKIQRKLVESRFFVLSVTIHIVLLTFVGSLFIIESKEKPSDFEATPNGIVVKIEQKTDTDELPTESIPRESKPKEQPVPTPQLDHSVVATNAQTDGPKVMVMNTNIRFDRSIGSDVLIDVIPKYPGPRPGMPESMVSRWNPAKTAIKNGGTPASEAAVLKGLNWLAKVQNPDGSWGDKNKGAMTGFALLCFLGHGETDQSQKYGVNVAGGVNWVLEQGTRFRGHLNMADGFAGNASVYEHAIVTYALGEYYTMSKDERVIELFKQAVGYIVQGQNESGAWNYAYEKSRSDLSVSGWQIQALKAAHLTGLGLPGVDAAMDKAVAALDKVFKSSDEQGYGYTGPQKKYSLTGVGILGRLFWNGDRGDVRKSMDWLLDETEKDNKAHPLLYRGDKADLYAWYYHTQAALMYGGASWSKWNRWFQDELVKAQNADGSWPAPGARGAGGLALEASMSGQVYRSTLCILMLEVFYRYMPVNKA